MKTFSLADRLESVRLCLPKDATEVVLNRATFEEVVNILGARQVRDTARVTTIDDFATNHLTKTENRILELVFTASGAPVKCERFRLGAESLWVHVRRLREKIETEQMPFRIETVRGRGYRLVWEDGQ